MVMLADRWFGFGSSEAAHTVDWIFTFTLLPAWPLGSRRAGKRCLELLFPSIFVKDPSDPALLHLGPQAPELLNSNAFPFEWGPGGNAMDCEH